MSIYQVKTTAVVCVCPVCHTTTETVWASLTFGNTNTVRTFAVTCGTCGQVLNYFLPDQRLNIAQLAIAEVFSLAKATASYYGAWVQADVTTALASLKKLSDYETVPFTVAEKVGQIHYTSAMLEKNAAQLLEIILQGHQLYGTETQCKGYIDALTVETGKRAILYKNNGVNV